MLRCYLLIFACLPPWGGAAFAFFTRRRSRTAAAAAYSLPHQSVPALSTGLHKYRFRLHMIISNPFVSSGGGGDGANKNKLPQLPRDVKEAVTRCREATQAALKDRISRMDIEFPVGTKFGVEKGARMSANKKRADETPTLLDLARSDRELARIFVEMFQPVGADHLVVAFADVEAADAAKEQWQDDRTAAARIDSLDRRKSTASAAKKKKAKVKGFAAKLASEIDDDVDESGPFQLPPNTEVALFVAPGPRELVVIERICGSVGMGTLVILLNARLRRVNNFGTAATEVLFNQEFEPVFHLSAAPQEAAPGCLLHRTYGKAWLLARKPAIGQPKTILAQNERPTSDQCKRALDTLELSDVEKNVESAMKNVGNWFR